MKMTKANLQLIGIHNPHNFCTEGGGHFCLIYHTQERGRMSSPAGWYVVGVKEKTDPAGPWYNHGQKVFLVYARTGDKDKQQSHHENKEAQRLAAIAWATEKYGISDWVKDPFGDYQERGVWERVAEKLKKFEAREQVAAVL